jgi:hypothetical protein
MWPNKYQNDAFCFKAAAKKASLIQLNQILYVSFVLRKCDLRDRVGNEYKTDTKQVVKTKDLGIKRKKVLLLSTFLNLLIYSFNTYLHKTN